MSKESDVATVVKDIGPDLDGDPADDGMDLTTPLAEPEYDDAPGDPTTPAVPRGKTSTPPPPRNGPASPSG